jgi:chaperonin GroEL
LLWCVRRPEGEGSATGGRTSETIGDVTDGDAAGGTRTWDFFISYTAVDRGWAEWVGWQLEDAGYQVLVQAWDFVPGSNWIFGIRQGVLHARQMIAILSRAYLESVFGGEEWEAVWATDPRGFARKLLPVRIEDCDRPGLLRGVVGFDLFDLDQDAARGYLLDQVTHSMSGRAKPATAPEFPVPHRQAPPIAQPSFPSTSVGPGGQEPARWRRIRAGVEAMCAPILRTLGPNPLPSVIRGEEGPVSHSTDSLVIASSSPLLADPDDDRQIGSRLVLDLVAEISGSARDGAASGVAFFLALIQSLVEALDGGDDVVGLRRRLDDELGQALETLRAQVIPLETKEQLAAIASMVAGDRDIGLLVSEAFDKVGSLGVVTVEESLTYGTELWLTEGMRFDNGALSREFLTERAGTEAVLEDPYILLVDGRVSTVGPLLPLLEKVLETGRPLAVIAQDVDGEALATLVVNHTHHTLRSVAVRAPDFGDHRTAMLGYIAVINGGQVISESVGAGLASATLDLLGRARAVVVTADDTTVVEGAGPVDGISARVEQIRVEIERSAADFDREKSRERLARIAGGVAVIKVGAGSGAALEVKKRSIENAVSSARAAIEGGILVGGGMALLRIGLSSRMRGALISRALEAPFLRILANSGHALEGVAIDDGLSSRAGFDVTSGQSADLIDAGVIDLATVVETELTVAGTMARLFLSLL